MNDSMIGLAEKQADLLEQILAIGQAIEQEIIKNPGKVYQLIVKATCEVTGADCAVLYPYHPSFGEFYDLDNIAACGLRHELQLEEKVDKRKGLTARVHRKGEVICKDTEQGEPQIRETPFIAREEIRAFMGLSLRVEENILGILYVDYRSPHRFSAEEKKIIRLFGQQATTAVSNSWSSRLADIRADTVARLKTVGLTLVAIRDPDETLDSVLDGIAHSAQDVLDADMVDLYQYVQARHEFVLPPVLVGERQYSQLIPRRIYDDDVVVRAVKMGEPQYFDDSQRTALLTEAFASPRGDAPTERFVIREGVVSSATIPLMAVGETVGVMFVNYRTSQLFGPEQKDVIESFAAQAAIAIHNSRLFNESLRQRNELRVVDKIGQLLMSTLDPGEIPRLLLQRVIGLFRVEAASLWQVDRTSREVRFLFALNPKGEEEPFTETIRGMTLRFGEGVVGTVAQSGKPMIVNQVEVEPLWDRRFDETTGFKTRSILAVPLVHKQETIGVIETLNRIDDAPFSVADQDFLAAIVSPAAIALENARLYQAVTLANRDLERRVEALSTLNKVGETLTSGLRLTEDEILELIYQQARKLTNTQNMYIALYDDTTQMIRFRLAMTQDQRTEIPEPRQADMKRRGKTEEVIFTKQPLLHKTKQESEKWYNLPDHANFIGRVQASYLGVPMMAGEKVLGMVAVYDWERQYAYDELDRQVLDSMADQAAIAIDNARLYYEVNRDLQRRVEALSTLTEVGQTLTSGLRLTEDQILELIYEQVRKLTGTQDMYIALYDEATEMIRFGLAMEEGKRIEIAKPRKADLKRRGKTEEIIFTKQPILHKTKQEAEAWYALPDHQEFTGQDIYPSWVGVPMILGEKVLGVIAIYDREGEYIYDELDLQVLASMADQAAIALDNASLYYEVNQALERRVEALSTLNKVGKTLTSGLRLTEDEILELVYQQAGELTEAQDMYIALYDNTTKMIRFALAMAEGQRTEIAESRQADMKRRGKTEEVIFTKQPLLHKTKQESEKWYKLPDHAEFIGRVQASYLGVPMMAGEKVLGMVAVYDWERQYAYDELDRQVLDSMADQAAIAIDNARLFEFTRRIADERQERLALLQQISARMVEAGLDPDEVLELVAQAANDISESDLTSIYLYDQEAGSFTRGVRIRREEKVEQVEPGELPDPEDLPAKIAQTREAIFVDNVQEHPETFTFAGHHQLQAFAGLPLTMTGPHGVPTTAGVLFVNFKQSHPFADDEREILYHLANQAAVAIAYASAQESAQAKEQLAALGTAAATLQHRLGNTINVILPAVMRLRYRVGDDPTNTDILDAIERNALFATEVIRRMQTPLRQEPFVRTNINSLLREAIQKCLQDSDRFPKVQLSTNLPDLTTGDVVPSTGEQQITITAELAEQLPETYASSGQLTEVFRVLVENAIKAIYPQAGLVTITSQLVSDQLRPYVEVTVSDTGKGIDEKTRSRLFKQPVPRKEFGEGAGLGLWLSHIIVRSHQGSLDLQSTALNKGSTFLVRLPILDQPPPSEAVQLGGVG